MLRIYSLQQWYALSDTGVEESPYDSEETRQFAGMNLGREGAPDESPVPAVPASAAARLDEAHPGRLERLPGGASDETAAQQDCGRDDHCGGAPIKNKARDPEIHQAKKGNQWYFVLNQVLSGVAAATASSRNVVSFLRQNP